MSLTIKTESRRFYGNLGTALYARLFDIRPSFTALTNEED
jgi:hypothetical protein